MFFCKISLILACRTGYFGFNCNSRCNCEGDSYECDHVYGNCSTSCVFGWTGFNCSTGNLRKIRKHTLNEKCTIV